jgi:hypothetical protein
MEVVSGIDQKKIVDETSLMKLMSLVNIYTGLHIQTLKSKLTHLYSSCCQSRLAHVACVFADFIPPELTCWCISPKYDFLHFSAGAG